LGLASIGCHLRGLPLAAAPSLLKPKRLAAGDTVALVNPASATFESVDVQIAKESLEALGLTVRLGTHMMERHGYLAGDDETRAADINALFADTEVAAIHPIRGGGGDRRDRRDDPAARVASCVIGGQAARLRRGAASARQAIGRRTSGLGLRGSRT
jgi:hypothetical protein